MVEEGEKVEEEGEEEGEIGYEGKEEGEKGVTSCSTTSTKRRVSFSSKHATGNFEKDEFEESVEDPSFDATEYESAVQVLRAFLIFFSATSWQHGKVS